MIISVMYDKKIFFISLFFLTLFISKASCDTNLGTINSLTRGFATLKECQLEQEDHYVCKNKLFNKFGDLFDFAIKRRGILKFATTNHCIASKAKISASGIKIPKCPTHFDKIQGLDNTFPTAGIFALYTGDNDNFIHDLASSFLKKGEGVFNLVLPKSKIRSLKKNPLLLNLLNTKKVNIITLNTMPSVQRWMQDSFQFTTIAGKPAIYQIENPYEKGFPFSKRLACILAKECNLPYYIPPDMVNPLNSDYNNQNSGGNLEVLPGGTFYRGIIKPRNRPFPTDYQKRQKKALVKEGNKVIDINTSFLKAKHVDEIINIIKTDQPAPCNFAVMIASPKKAFQLIESSSIDRPKANINLCKQYSYQTLMEKGSNHIISSEVIKNIYKNNCIDDLPAHQYIKSKEYHILKAQNLFRLSPKSPESIMKENEQIILRELRSSSGCQNPKVIHVPVFFRIGVSYTPNLINSVVQTPVNSPSHVILPRSYFAPFDLYVSNELRKVGVKTSFVHDMGYHLKSGEVHCGTNSARICNP